MKTILWYVFVIIPLSILSSYIYIWINQLFLGIYSMFLGAVVMIYIAAGAFLWDKIKALFLRR